jgi:PEP-CTERM motif
VKRLSSLSLIIIALSLRGVLGDIIPSFDSASAFGNNAVWNYDINVVSQTEVQTGDFFTIYDFGNFIPGSNSQPIGWALTASDVGTTPGQVLPTDNPSVLNLTWTFDGPTIIGPALDLGVFRVTVAGPVSPLGISQFASQSTLASGPNAGTKLQNIGAISVPIAIPEPGTSTLLAIGAAFLGRAIFRRRKS